MSFEVLETKIEGVKVIKSDIFLDERGYFKESFNMRDFMVSGLPTEFRQDNVSCSKKGVIRGLHYQVYPYQQIKYVSCLQGRIIDFAVDLRFNSDTFLNYVGVELTPKNGNTILIPGYCAHGFVALEKSIVFYKASNLYSTKYERCIKYDDPDIGIDWGKYEIDEFIISEKDKNASYWKQSEVF